MLSTPPAFEQPQTVGEGFRPTEEELLNHYLKLMMLGRYDLVCRIPVVDLCEHEPWDLAQLSAKSSKGSEWYFFSLRRSLKGGGASRQTKNGSWKSTGYDRTIKDKNSNKKIGKQKILVYYRGRPPCQVRTGWIIHEYSLPNQEAIVLCNLIKKPENKANLLANDKGEAISEMGQMASDFGYQILDGNSSFNLPTPVSDEGCYFGGYTATQTSYNEVYPCSLLNFDIPHQVPSQIVLEDCSPADPNWTDWLVTSTNANNASYTTTPAELVAESQFQGPYFGYNQEGYNLSSTTPETYIPTDTEPVYVPDYGFGCCSTFIPSQDLQTWSNNYAIDAPMQPEGGFPYDGIENLVNSAENIFYGLPPLWNSI